MSTKLQSPEVDGDLQKEEENENENENEDQITKNMEPEIECSRCYDVMTSSSDFDHLGYFCQECDLLLVMK